MVHGEEQCHCKDDSSEPWEDRQGHEHEPEEYGRQHEDDNLRVPLRGRQSKKCSRSSIYAHLTQRLLLFDSILSESSLFQCPLPRPEALQPHRHISRRSTFAVSRCNVCPGLYEPPDTNSVTANNRPVEWGQASVILGVWAGAVLQEQDQ